MSYKKIPKHLQKKTVEKNLLFRCNPLDKRLETHKLSGKLSGYWSYSVDYHYRVLFRFISEIEAIYFNVGTHNIYKRH